jgi:hypothetical protein
MPEPYAPGAFTKTRRAILEAAARGEISVASDGRYFWTGRGRWVNEPGQWLVHHGLAVVDETPGNPGRLVPTDLGRAQVEDDRSFAGTLTRALRDNGTVTLVRAKGNSRERGRGGLLADMCEATEEDRADELGWWDQGVAVVVGVTTLGADAGSGGLW